MSEHFENLWEKSEIVAEKFYQDLVIKDNSIEYSAISKLQDNLFFLKLAIDNKDIINQSNIIGEILFNLTFLSKKLNINTYSVLKEHIEDIKIEMLDQDIDNTDE